MIFKIFYIFLVGLFFLSTSINKSHLFNEINSAVEAFNIHFNRDIQMLRNEIDFLHATKKELPFSGYKIDENMTYFNIDGTGVYFKNIVSYPNQFSFYNLKEAKDNLNSKLDNSLLYIVHNNIRSFAHDRKVIYTDDFSQTWVNVLKTSALSLAVFKDKRTISRNNTEFALHNLYVDKVHNKEMFTIIFPNYEYFNNAQKLRSLWYFDFNRDFFAKNSRRLKRTLNLNTTIIDSEFQVIYSTEKDAAKVVENIKDYYVFPLEKTNYKILIEKENLFHLVNLKEIFLLIFILFSVFYINKKEKLNKELNSLKMLNKIKSKLLLREPLTALYNRYYLQEEMKFPINNCGVVLLDIDHFKNINDKFGHDKGDFVLKGVSNCIKLIANKNIYPFRWGGEEFLIIFRDIGQDELLNQVYFLQKLIRDLDLIENHKITASFGVFHADIKDRTSFYSSVSKADEKLYTAKNSGRDKIIY
ncbi:GGDEF domain-containing protein [Cetobacterium somerae]|uniref:GGDEF domain-containing protein n=1 Tax=Cetobacterium sp. NK01 TaxID=2993530 RepID=UPI002115D665|nr:GGDEF domain-containing protein [Cetobacterium sp. NK01]MCQ8212077.1 GGDEF domain-containing protein [Cetobacterium sp. NK01]